MTFGISPRLRPVYEYTSALSSLRRNVTTLSNRLKHKPKHHATFRVSKPIAREDVLPDSRLCADGPYQDHIT